MPGACHVTMRQTKSCLTRCETNENSSDYEKMVENQQCYKSFTNFSVSEILKPDFGRKYLAGGVLKLLSGKKIEERICTNTLRYCCGLVSQTSITNHVGLNISAGSPHISPNETNPNSYIRHHIDRDIQNSKNFGYALKANNRHDSLTKSTHRDTDSRRSSCESDGESSPASSPAGSPGSSVNGNRHDGKLWPAWVYCTRYSDRPSAGPRSRKIRHKDKETDEKRPRTAFTTDQLRKLKDEFGANKYLSESRRQQLARELNLNESQIKIWFQNKRAKIKKVSGERNELALELIAQGLYNHKTVKLES